MTWSTQAHVGCDLAASEITQDKADSTVTKMSTASKGPTFLTIPLEIRERIYELASEEVIDINSEFTSREKNTNPGRSLLLVSRQVYDEAKPFLYRTLTINGYEPTSYVARIENSSNHLNYTRRVDIHFTCFCQAPVEDYDWCEAWPVHYEQWTFWRDRWSTILKVVQKLPLVEDLGVTFDTCCRRTLQLPRDIDGFFFTSWGRDPSSRVYSAMDFSELATIIGARGYCVALENYFLRLLEESTYVDKLTVRGNVPPSWIFHLLKPNQNGFKLKLHHITEGLCSYIKSREASTLAEEYPAIASDSESDHSSGPNAIKTPYPKEGANVILVNTKRDPKLSLWEKHMGPEWSGMPMEGDYSFMEFLKESKSVDDLEMSLDYTDERTDKQPWDLPGLNFEPIQF